MQMSLEWFWYQQGNLIVENQKAIHLKNYYIDKTEVTQKNFKKVMGPANFF